MNDTQKKPLLSEFSAEESATINGGHCHYSYSRVHYPRYNYRPYSYYRPYRYNSNSTVNVRVVIN